MEPVLKWAGGKRQLLTKLLPYINNNRLNPVVGIYYEPFFGGGSLCFNLEFPRAVINDFNPEIANVYRQIKEHPLELIELLSKYDTKRNKEEYYQTREWDRLESYANRSLIEKASRIIYLNRTCFNGLYRVNQRGEFNTPIGSVGFPFELIKARILEISRYFNENDIRILNGDFAECVANAGEGDFVYFDPPYDYEKDGFTLYVDAGFTRNDLVRLKQKCDELIERGCSVMISNNKTSFVEALFDDPRYQIEVIDANRWINSDGTNRTHAKEVVIYGVQ